MFIFDMYLDNILCKYEAELSAKAEHDIVSSFWEELTAKDCHFTPGQANLQSIAMTRLRMPNISVPPPYRNGRDPLKPRVFEYRCG